MDNSVPQRQCLDCKDFFPPTTEFFHKNPRGRDKLSSYCKPCHQARAKRNKQKPEQKAKTRKTQQKWYQANKEKSATHRKRWYQANREYALEKDRQFRIDHPEILAQRWQNWYQTENGKEHSRTRVRNRKSRKKATPGAHTAQEIREQYDRQKGKCYYCQHKVKWGEHWVDHTFPISREFARNSIDHLVITCETCNERKGNKYPHEFFEGGRLL